MCVSVCVCLSVFLSVCESVSVCKVGLKKRDSENGPGPGDAAKYAYVSPTSWSVCTLGRGPRPWGRRGQWGAPLPHFVHPPDESAAGSAGWRPRLPGPGRWEKPSSWRSGFLPPVTPGSPASPANPQRRACGRRPHRDREARQPPRPAAPPGLLRRRVRGAAAPLARPGGVPAGAPHVFPRPPTSQQGDSGPWRAGVWRDLGREAGRTAAASQSRAPRVCLNVRAAGLILAAPGERRLLPSLLPLSPGER